MVKVTKIEIKRRERYKGRKRGVRVDKKVEGTKTEKREGWKRFRRE